MKYLKLASSKNPNNDFIELNDFQGFLCTNFQTIGISRKLDFLEIKNQNFVVRSKPNFKKYILTIEILSKYSEYEAKHRQLITFLERNKQSGFRLYFEPYENMGKRYCLCDIESSVKIETMKPVTLNLIQSSLWFGEEKIYSTTYSVNEKENIFSFGNDGNGYYSTGFYYDEDIEEYCIEFFNNIFTEAEIENNSYNEIPLNLKIFSPCVNPIISLYKKGENKVFKQVEIIANIDEGYYIEINSDVRNNGVWLVNKNTKEKIDYSETVNNSIGSPFIYIEHGNYIVKAGSKANDNYIVEISIREEYNE